MIRYFTYSLVLVISLCISITLSAQYGPYDVISTNNKYSYSHQQTPDNLAPVYPVFTGTSYSWEQCLTPGFDPGSVTVIGTSATYTFTAPLSQTTWFRRKTTVSGNTIISNVLKIEVVSIYREDRNYVREHTVLVSGQTDWKAIDQLPIGQKLQTTTYTDGLGRPVQQVSKQTATPATGSNTWGDIVQFYEYDSYGREVKKYLPYTTLSQPGEYKANAVADQSAYYANAATYNESAPYTGITYDNSPLNRTVNVKQPGTSWAAGTGVSMDYGLNDATDDVQQFTIAYSSGSLPVAATPYAANTLYKLQTTDEEGREAVSYRNGLGQTILSKIRIAGTPANAYNGWICTYYVYDDFGRLRFEMQPEAVKWLAAHSWSFTGADGQKVADELCFRYEYDARGRMILKKAPGAAPLRMLYDQRDRVALMQDGNQAAQTPAEWTVNLYDDLDRLVLTTLYHTTKTIAQLQTDIDNAVTLTTITLTNPGQPVQDIVTDHRQPGIAEYVAQHSIELHPGFESATGDNFIAKIDPGALTPIPVTTAVLGSPLSQSDLNNPAICTVVKYQFYDNYSFAKAQSFDNNIANTTAWPAGTDILPVAPDERTTGFATGSLVRVLGTDIFLASTHYYDADGNLIQTIEENIRSGTDVTTLQYHWDGRLLSTHSKHTTAGTGYSSYSILTKNVFDNIGRLVAIQKKYGSNAFKTIATYDLDDMGRLKTKHLDPDLAGGGLESLTYSYNIHNNITGINKDYALQTPGKYSKWEHYFGLYLGYDNRDGVFGASKLSGQVTGQMWNTQGDDNQRKYDYAYDDAGRLSKAAYNERKTPGEAWSNAKMDFSTGGNGTGGTIQYDLNGNLLSMQQRGVVPGAGAPATIDDLAYTYTSLSNRLKKVTDNSPLGAANGMLGDFKDGVNGGEDYLYDDNGNLIIDLNKKAQNVDGGKSTPLGTTGMLYNYLDKPESIHISGKGTIRIVYDADGNKLQRIYTPNGGTATTTTYINRFVYEESPSQGVRLSYINFEEGRIRVLNAITQNNGYDGLAIDGNIDLPDGRRGAYDYFIRDYQQNVRMILTEETHYGINEATMEAGRAAQEEPFFGQTGAANEVAQTRSSTPSGWTSNTSGSVSKLSKSSGHTIGPNVLLKVMAGDEFNAMAGYYYAGAVTNNTNPLISDIVASLVTAISGSPATPGIVHGNTANISSNLNGSVPFATIADPHQTGSGNIPRAYLNIMFFDERFEFVEEGSTVKRVSQPGDGAAPLVLSGIKAPKNGYVYIYLSNENDDAVYFDNFTVSYTRGRIIEENHYYAYGLKIAAISSRKLGDVNEGSLKNQYQWQGDYSEFDDDLNWNEFNLRSYDPQTGRFLQQDPYDQFASGYVGMGSDPVNLTDPSGGFSVPGAVIGGVAGFIAGGAYALANDKNPVTGALLGAAGGALLGGLVGDLNFGGATQAVGGALKSAAPSLAIQGANFAVNTINTNITNQYARYAGYGGDGWQDLTKPILENYYSGRYPLLTPGQLQNVIGRSFEQAWNLAADRLLKSDNYVPNSDKQTGGTRTTVPDGIADGYIQKVWGGRITVPRAAWFEVKAINGNIYNSTSTGQTLGHITNLAASVPAKYRWYGPWKASAASLTFVTTSDVAIAPSVLTEASLSNIIIYQYKAQYMMSGGFMSVRFRMTSRNGIGFFGPTTTPVVLR